jgi:hypothetical protein
MPTQSRPLADPSGPRTGEQYLYVFKGAPSARHAYGRNRLRELARATGESRSPGGPVISGKGLSVAGRQLSPRPSGGSPTARRAAAHGCPGTGRSRSPPSRPDAVPHEQGQAITIAPSAPIAVRRVTATGTERRALSRSAPPASRAPQDPF